MPWPHGGLGTEESPYLVPNADALDDVRDYVGEDVYFKQTADISLSDYQEGAGWVPLVPVDGTVINHGGYKVEGLRISRNANDQGLYGNFRGNISDLKIYDAQVVNLGSNNQGIFAARGNGTAYRIYVGDPETSGGSVLGTNNTGGIAGIGNEGFIECFANCSSECRTGGVNCGTAFGRVTSAPVRCIGMGTAKAPSGSGGFVGVTAANTFGIVDCACFAAVTGGTNTGGFVGEWGTNTGLTRCFADSSVTPIGSPTAIGGFWGVDAATSPYEYLYWNKTKYATNPPPAEGSYPVGLTSEEMANSSNFEGFDFDNVWYMADVPGFGVRPWLRALAGLIPEPSAKARALFMFAGL